MLPALRRCPALSAQVTGKLVVDAGAPGAAIPDIVSIEQPKSTSRRRFGLFYEVAEYYYFAEEPYYFVEEPTAGCAAHLNRKILYCISSVMNSS